MTERALQFRAHIDPDTTPRLIDSPAILQAHSTQACIGSQEFDDANSAIGAAMAAATKLDQIAASNNLLEQQAYLHGFDIQQTVLEYDPGTGDYSMRSKALEAQTDTPGDTPTAMGTFLGFTGIAKRLDNGLFLPEVRYHLDINARPTLLPTFTFRPLVHSAISPDSLEFLEDKRRNGAIEAIDTLLRIDSIDLQTLLHNTNALLPAETEWELSDVKAVARAIRHYFENRASDDTERDAFLDLVMHRLALYEGQSMTISAYGAAYETEIGIKFKRNFTSHCKVLGIAFGRNFFFQKKDIGLSQQKNSLQIITESSGDNNEAEVWWIPFEKIRSMEYGN